MFQRNLLISTSGRSKHIASHPEDHNLDVQWCHIHKFHIPPSCSTDYKTKQSHWDLSLYNVVQPELFSTMNMETIGYSETQAHIYQVIQHYVSQYCNLKAKSRSEGCRLFNDSVSIKDYIALNAMAAYELRIQKEVSIM